MNNSKSELVYDHYQDVHEKFPDEVHKQLMPEEHAQKLKQKSQKAKKDFESLANLHIVDQALLAGNFGGPSVEEGDDAAGRAGGAQAEAGKGGAAVVDTDAADQMNDSNVFEGKGKGNAPAAESSKPYSASLEDSDDSDNSGSDDQSSSGDDSSDEYSESGDDSS